MWKIDAYTSLYGIIGNPVRHSFSPAIHNCGFQLNNQNAVYLAFEVVDLASAVKGIRTLGVCGVSVTIPYKEAVIPYLDGLDEVAQTIGSVNTIYRQNDKLFGTNTDAFGFYRALSEKVEPEGKTVAVFGSGGSARSVCFAALYYGKPQKLVIIARNEKTKSTLKNTLIESLPQYADRIETLSPADWKSIQDNVDIIINTTPMGMLPHSNECILEEEDIPPNITVMDIVYRPHQTLLLERALRRECQIVYGVDMLLYQGVRQFEIWTGQKAPVKEMRLELERVIHTLG